MLEGIVIKFQPDLNSRTATCPIQKQMKCLVSWVTYEPKLRPTTQCQVGLYFLSNSFLMQAAISFSMLNFSSATLAQSIASCCISSFMSACLITAFRSAVDIINLIKQNQIHATFIYIRLNYLLAKYRIQAFIKGVSGFSAFCKLLFPQILLITQFQIMITFERQRKNRTTFIEMKSAANMQEKDKHIQKLGGSIKATIDKLKRLRTDIQAEYDLRKLATLMATFEKQNNYYNELQVSLGQINEQSELYTRIKKMNKDFIQNYDPEQLKKKFDYMRSERMQHINTEKNVEMSAINQQQLSGQLMAADKHEIRNKILMQQMQQLTQIERMIKQVKDIATKTSIMINAQGEKIQLSLEKMKKANMNLKDGRELLNQANQYQQDTNKKYMVFCFLTVLIVSIIVLIMYSSSKKQA